ncbi:hypothetical protein WA158_007171 [Blastocystis sp. Blastoise]
MPKAVSKYYPAYDITPKPKGPAPKQAKLRSTIVPGTVLIILAGRFHGKRVVFLKQLESGLLLVSGPYKINGVPLRRINPCYVIATSTKVDVANVTIPEHINDAYFTKKEEKKTREEIFFDKDIKPIIFIFIFFGPAVIAEERKADQKAVDAALLANIEKVKYMKQYLNAKFSLTKYDHPHDMKF